MQTRIKLGLQTLRRAHAFLAQHEFQAALGDIAPQTAALSRVIEQLEAHATAQESRRAAAKAASDLRLESLLRLRREFLRPIAHMARTLLADDPEVRRTYRVPKSIESEGLLQTAGAFAERVAEQRDRFVAHGLAPDFVERLQDAVRDYHDQRGVRHAEVARRVAATEGLQASVSRGRAILRLIDLMLSPRLAHNPALLAEWRSISRFVRRAQPASPLDVPGDSEDQVPTNAAPLTISSATAPVPVPVPPARSMAA